MAAPGAAELALSVEGDASTFTRLVAERSEQTAALRAELAAHAEDAS